LILGALLLIAQGSPAAEPSGVLIDRWRESIELDLPGEVLLEALPLVTDDGKLSRDGAAIAVAARALAAAGEGARAGKLLDEAHPDENSRSFVEVARARLALDRDDLPRARRILLEPSSGPKPADPPVRFPSIAECWLLAGRALARSGELAQATPLLERFLALAPLDSEAPSAWHMLTQAAIVRGDPTDAAELRKKSLASAAWQDFYRTRRLQVREKPGEPLPRLGIAELFLAVGEHERAREVGSEITGRWPDFCRGHEALGRAERGLGHLALARAALERAAACDPRSTRAHLELARVLAASGETERAAASYARYRELGGSEPLAER
jgi:tetratricopeptide (TPR) repeat protein